MLDKLFESIDENILTAETKAELQQMFNESVELKATEIASVEIAEKTKILEESYEKQFQDSLKLMTKSLDKYLDESVKNVVDEIKSSLKDSLNVKRAEALIEAFDVSLLASGVNVGTIGKEINDSSYQSKLENLKESYDILTEKYNKLEKQSRQMIQYGTIAELKEGLSLVEQNKFDSLAKLVPFEQTKAYFGKLKTLRESVKGSTEKSEINESVVDTKKKVVTESVKGDSWKRFV